MNHRRILTGKPTILVTAVVAAVLLIALVTKSTGALNLISQAAGTPVITSSGTASGVKQLVQNVESGESVTAGDTVGFLNGHVQKGPQFKQIGFHSHPAGTSYPSLAVLSSTKFVIVYNDDIGTSHKATAVIGDVSGSTIAYGTEYVFHSSGMSGSSVAALSSTKFVVAFNDPINPNKGTAIIGDVSGNSITYGTEYVFNSDATGEPSVAALSSTKFVVAYYDYGNASYGTVVIGDVSANSVTYGAEYVFNSADTKYISAAALSSTKFVVAYKDVGNSNKGTAVIGDVSGNSITCGTEYVFHAGKTAHESVAALYSTISSTSLSNKASTKSSTKFVVAYSNIYDYGTAVIGDVSGNSITYGAEYTFNPAGGTSSISTSNLSSTKFVVAYTDGGNGGKKTAVIGDASGNSIAYGTEHVYNSDANCFGDNPSVAGLSSTRFVAAYLVGTPSSGNAVIRDVSGNTISLPPAPTVYFIGIAKESKTAGQLVPVIVGGVSDVHSGLTPGKIYYSDESGTLTTTVTAYKVGLALSATEILLSIKLP